MCKCLNTNKQIKFKQRKKATKSLIGRNQLPINSWEEPLRRLSLTNPLWRLSLVNPLWRLSLARDLQTEQTRCSALVGWTGAASCASMYLLLFYIQTTLTRKSSALIVLHLQNYEWIKKSKWSTWIKLSCSTNTSFTANTWWCVTQCCPSNCGMLF